MKRDYNKIELNLGQVISAIKKDNPNEALELSTNLLKQLRGE